MLSKKTWALELYFCFILFTVAGKIYRIFSPESPTILYLQILNAFSGFLSFAYIVNILQIIVNTISLAPIYLYIKNKSIFSVKFWRYVFILKIIFDLAGHPYETKEIISTYYFSHKIFFIILLTTALIHLPWYITFFKYAFKRPAS